MSGGQYSKIFLELGVQHTYCYDLSCAKEYLSQYSNQTITDNLMDIPDSSIDIFFARLSIPYINIYKFFEIVDKKLKKNGQIYIRYHSFAFYKNYFFSNPIRTIVAIVNYLLIKTIKKNISLKIKDHVFNDIIYTRKIFKKFNKYKEISYEKHEAPIIILRP